MCSLKTEICSPPTWHIFKTMCDVIKCLSYFIFWWKLIIIINYDYNYCWLKIYSIISHFFERIQCTYKCFISLPLNDLTGHNRTKKEYKDEYPTKQKSDCPNLRKHSSKCLGRATFCLPIKGTLKTLEQMFLRDSFALFWWFEDYLMTMFVYLLLNRDESAADCGTASPGFKFQPEPK